MRLPAEQARRSPVSFESPPINRYKCRLIRIIPEHPMCHRPRTIRTPSGLFRGGNRQWLTPLSQRPVSARSRFLESCDPTNMNDVCGETLSESEKLSVVQSSPVSKLESAIDALQKFYGALPRPPRDPFTLFVWEVLSTHSTDRKRDAALAALKHMAALTPDTMWQAPHNRLADAVALAGPYLEQRLRALRTGIDRFRRTPDLPTIVRGERAAARRALKGLPQMGEAGAYRMLLFAADHPVLPVDARVSRVARRLGYGTADQKSWSAHARSIREAVARELPDEAEAYRRAFVYLAHHGAMTCTE